MGVKSTTQNTFVYGELGRTPLRLTRHNRIIKYWLKIVCGNANNLVKSVYRILYNQCEMENVSNWASLIKSLLFTHGFGYVWYFQGVGNVNIFMSLFKRRVTDVYLQNWHTEVSGSTRARFYIQLVNIGSFEYKKYLDMVNIRKLRVAMTRLRVSSHRLSVESGRWHRPVSIPYERRLCTICDVIEDEYHFVLVCCNYSGLRHQFIPKRYYDNPNRNKLSELVSSDNMTIIKNLATFIFKANEVRNVLMYDG